VIGSTKAVALRHIHDLETTIDYHMTVVYSQCPWKERRAAQTLYSPPCSTQFTSVLFCFPSGCNVDIVFLLSRGVHNNHIHSPHFQRQPEIQRSHTKPLSRGPNARNSEMRRL
jgi:hypothetical protein